MLDFKVVISITGRDDVVLEPENKFPVDKDQEREEIFWTLDRAIGYLVEAQSEYEDEVEVDPDQT